MTENRTYWSAGKSSGDSGDVLAKRSTGMESDGWCLEVRGDGGVWDTKVGCETV